MFAFVCNQLKNGGHYFASHGFKTKFLDRQWRRRIGWPNCKQLCCWIKIQTSMFSHFSQYVCICLYVPRPLCHIFTPIPSDLMIFQVALDIQPFDPAPFHSVILKMLFPL